MIGQFRYDPTPGVDVIALYMVFDSAGRPAGRVVVPEAIRRSLIADDVPDPQEPRELESALAYAVFIAARANTALRISGDLSVWPEHWGRLRHSS